MLAEVYKWRGPRSIITNMQFLAINPQFRIRRDEPVQGMYTVKHVDFTCVNGLAVRLQTLHFMKPLFSKFKSSKSKIEIQVGISIFVEHV